MTLHDVDLAVKRLRRRLDKIMACTSGMPNYEIVAERIAKLRAAIDAVEGRPKVTVKR
jgi:hypothetical protein